MKLAIKIPLTLLAIAALSMIGMFYSTQHKGHGSFTGNIRLGDIATGCNSPTSMLHGSYIKTTWTCAQYWKLDSSGSKMVLYTATRCYYQWSYQAKPQFLHSGACTSADY